MPPLVGALQGGGIEGPAMVKARQNLKHAEGAVPLGRDDVDAAA